MCETPQMPPERSRSTSGTSPPPCRTALPIQLLARDAAASAVDAAEIWKQIRHETLTAMTMFASDLARTGQLRVSATQARDVLWTYHAPELYELLVLERGWSASRYGKFVTRALSDALLETRS